MAAPLVVLDTNCLFDDPTFTSSPVSRLLALARRRRIHLLVPIVVLNELQRHHFRTVASRIDQLQKVRSKTESAIRLLDLDAELYSVTFPDFNDLDAAEITQSIFDRVQDRLEASGVEILPLPDVSHAEVLDRDLATKLPFVSSGKGYRDALIWLSIVERWKTPTAPSHGYIVTSDTDFGADGLAQDLTEELPTGSTALVVPTIAALLALDHVAELDTDLESQLLVELLLDADEEFSPEDELDRLAYATLSPARHNAPSTQPQKACTGSRSLNLNSGGWGCRVSLKIWSSTGRQSEGTSNWPCTNSSTGTRSWVRLSSTPNSGCPRLSARPTPLSSPSPPSTSSGGSSAKQLSPSTATRACPST